MGWRLGWVECAVGIVVLEGMEVVRSGGSVERWLFRRHPGDGDTTVVLRRTFYAHDLY